MQTSHFNTFPILSTERLTLRELSMGDQENIFALRSDYVVNKYLNRKPSETIENAINFIHNIQMNTEKSDTLYWVITLSETKTFVGTICLFNFSPITNSCEIGFELITKFQGKGIMKEAAEKVITYISQILQYQQIMAFTHKENQRSIQLLTKLNFIKSKETDSENQDCIIFILNLNNNH